MLKRFTATLLLLAGLAAGAADMAELPGGTFTMGDAGGKPDEAPHQVTVGPFLIDRCEVTQAEYSKLMGANPAKFKGDRRPVECVTWFDAALFCNERSRREGLKPCYNEETFECDFSADGYRLPTEAEWEYACRAGSSGPLNFSQGDLSRYAWTRRNSRETTHPVGSLQPNAWGIHDMYGNVSEWCNDWYAPSPAGGVDPRGAKDGDKKVLRGGSWKIRERNITSSRRDKDSPATADICQGYDNYGFRCVRRVKNAKAVPPPAAAPAAPKPDEKPVTPQTAAETPKKDDRSVPKATEQPAEKADEPKTAAAPAESADEPGVTPKAAADGAKGKPHFQSWEFLFFFLPFLALYAAFRRTKLRVVLLLVASYAFYAWWDWRFPVFLAVVTVSDYLIGRAMEHCGQGGRKWLLAESCLINLGILCSFKYLDFITVNLVWLFGKCGVTLAVPKFSWILPVGLSFFTFKSLSYTCDVCSGKLRPEKNFVNYAAYVAFFPQLVAGPIERAGSLLPQLKHAMPLTWNDLSVGISIFVSGLFKKVVMADMLKAYADPIFKTPSQYGGLALLFAAIAFSWQIYFDFSGYSDMARGAARMLGFRTVLNFDNPYVAVDVRDFWRRWHISLSSWFRDYVYIPLGGSRRIKIRVWWNVFVTMLVSGLWHGAAWTFVIWGGANGVGSVVSSTFDRSAWYQKIPKFPKQLAVFVFMTFTWVFFNSKSLGSACAMLSGIGTWQGGASPVPVIPFAVLGAVWIYELVWASRYRSTLESRPARIAAFAIVLLAIMLLGSGENTQFIYEQF